MKLEKSRARNFSRRAVFLLGGQMALMTGLAGRLYYLQVIESERYAVLAEENRVNFRLLPPPRGLITDRNGAPLAVNIQNYRLVLVPEQARAAGGVDATIIKLAQLIDISEGEIRRVRREAGQRRAFVPITVREHMSWEEVSRIGVNTPDLPGVSIEVGRLRHYPLGAQTAHVVGYVGAVTQKDAKAGEDPLLELPGFRIGKDGLERRYDLALRGAAGNSQVEVNALGRVIRELKRHEGQPGQEIRLTMDLRLQRTLNARLMDYKAASAVVLNIHNGAVLAMASVPSFDPNGFTEGFKPGDWRRILDNPFSPLSNKVIAGQYAPGSTFKIVMTLAALENGIAPDFTVFCDGGLDMWDRRFHCWKEHGHGRMDMIGALRESCDVWYYEAALKIGIDRIAETARRLGLDMPTGIDLEGELAGLIPTRQWKRDHLHKSWIAGETLLAGIGQGYVLSTPLQLAVMTARIANGGKAVVPHLSERQIEGEGTQDRAAPDFPDIGIDPAHLKTILTGLDQVVNHPLGTASGTPLNLGDLVMAGKTGTSQVRRISAAEREEGIRAHDEMEWRLRDHSLFVGFAPVHDPRYAVAVVVEHGGSGSATAAPIARDILRETLRLESQQTADGASGPTSAPDANIADGGGSG